MFPPPGCEALMTDSSNPLVQHLGRAYHSIVIVAETVQGATLIEGRERYRKTIKKIREIKEREREREREKERERERGGGEREK